MARLPVVTYPDAVLLQKALPVTVFDESVVKLGRDMTETMYAADGVGLAAPQVGKSLRLIVLDVAADEDRGKSPLALVNPEIVEKDGEVKWDEGCLSLPGITVSTKRASRVVVKAQSLTGEPVEVRAEGLLAVALQHEIDHLEGTLLLDHASKLRRMSLIRELRRNRSSDE